MPCAAAQTARPVPTAEVARRLECRDADRALAALLSDGGELVADRRALPVGGLRYFADRRRTGSVIVEVVESPWGCDRDVLDAAAERLRSRGFRARAFAGWSRLLIAADRGSR